MSNQDNPFLTKLQSQVKSNPDPIRSPKQQSSKNTSPEPQTRQIGRQPAKSDNKFASQLKSGVKSDREYASYMSKSNSKGSKSLSRQSSPTPNKFKAQSPQKASQVKSNVKSQGSQNKFKSSYKPTAKTKSSPSHTKSKGMSR